MVHELGPRWWVKIADFGISERALPDGSVHTQAFTMNYVAPEVLVCGHNSRTVDIWGVGVMAYELLTGGLIVFSKSSEKVQYFNGKLDFPAQPLEELKVSVPGCQFVQLLLSPKPQHRPPSSACLEYEWLATVPHAFEESSKGDALKDVETKSAHSDHGEVELPSGQPAKPSVFVDSLACEPYSATSGTEVDQISCPEPRARTSGGRSNTQDSSPSYTLASTFEATQRDSWPLDGHSTHPISRLGTNLEQFPAAGKLKVDSFIPQGKSASANYGSQVLHNHGNITNYYGGTTQPEHQTQPDRALEYRASPLEPLSEGVTVLGGHSEAVSGLTFSADGSLLVTTSQDKTVQVWDVATGVRLNRFVDTSCAATFLPHLCLLATASAHNRVSVLTLADPSGRHVVYPGAPLTRTLKSEIPHVTAMSFSPDGLLLATASSDETYEVLKLWRVMTGTEVRRSVLEESTRTRVASIVFTTDSRFLATATSCSIWVWNAASGGEVWRLSAASLNIRNLSFSRDGQLAGGPLSDKDSVLLWDVLTGANVQSQPKIIADSQADLIMFSPRGHLLLAIAHENMVVLWDVETRRRKLELEHEYPITAMAFSPRGCFLATASTDYTARVWDLRSAEQVQEFSHRGDISCLAFSPDGRFLAGAADDLKVRLWTLKENADDHL